MILALFALVFGFILMWILSWLTATPVRVVRAALNRVEQGDLDTNLVVFDGTELGQLQRGFNSMVHGLRERERVRDLFGRHVGREVAALAEKERPEARRRGAPRRGHLRRHHRLDPAGDQPARRRGGRAAEPVLRGDRRRGRPPPRVGQQVRGRRRACRVRRPGVTGQRRGRGAGRGTRDGRAPPRRGARVRGRHRGGRRVRWWRATSAPRNASSTPSSASRSTRPPGCASCPRTSTAHLVASSDTVSTRDRGRARALDVG